MFLVRWFYEGSEPSSACNRERIQLVDNQYAPKALSNDTGTKAHFRLTSKGQGDYLAGSDTAVAKFSVPK